MKNYELVLLLNPSIQEKDQKDFVESLEKEIKILEKETEKQCRKYQPISILSTSLRTGQVLKNHKQERTENQ